VNVKGLSRRETRLRGEVKAALGGRVPDLSGVVWLSWAWDRSEQGEKPLLSSLVSKEIREGQAAVMISCQCSGSQGAPLSLGGHCFCLGDSHNHSQLLQ
jgi:hypothetical protein